MNKILVQGGNGVARLTLGLARAAVVALRRHTFGYGSSSRLASTNDAGASNSQHHRRPVLAIALAALIWPATAAAQDVQLANQGALLFNMGGLFSSTPAAFDGVGIGGKWFPDSQMAWRFGAGMNFSSVTQEFKTPGGNTDTDTSTKVVAVEGGLEWVLARAKKAYLYTGGIGQLGYASTDPDGGDNDTTGYTITAAGLIGANYFLLEGLSVGAEYRLGISYASTTIEQGSNEQEQSTLTLGVGSVGFHLGFWFSE